MTQTAWAHLPNAKHIDWVLASVKEHPEMWAAAWEAERYAAYVAASWDAGRTAAYNAACATVWTAAGNAAYATASYAIAALVAYDDCAYMIESEVGELKIIAKLGDQRAILLLPSCIAYNETKMLTNTSIAV